MFTEHFSTTDKEQWLAQVQKDLKDPNVYESLRWQTSEGFMVEPYYTADNVSALPLSAIQSAQKSAPGWLNAPEQHILDEKTDNVAFRNALSRGADALVLSWPSVRSGEATDLARLLNGIKLSDTPIFFRLHNQLTEFTATLRKVAPYQLKGGILADPLAYWVTTGKPYAETLAAIVEATHQTTDSPQFRTIAAGSHAFHNAGATATQELAFLFASLADQYDILSDAGVPIDRLFSKTLLSVSIGTSYFVEIAKLRALRVLWQRFNAAYNQPESAYPLLHAQTSTFYDAVATPYTNLLRATTEAMAAVVGGCDVLTVHPYDTIFEAPSDFSERIARNISVLLRDESYLDKVADPSAGSYYIEVLTHQLVESAWALFLQVEAIGGFVKAFEQGFVQDEIERSYHAKVDAVRNGRVLVGVTKFRHDEKPVSETYKVFETAPAARIMGLDNSLLLDRRLAQEFEALPK